MKSSFSVKIQANKSDKSEYVIRDLNDIVVGRANIIELNKTKKRCDIRLRFYRKNEYKILRDTLILFLQAIFKDVSIYKVNISTLEGVDVNAFLDLGFLLQGILSENEYYNGQYADELMFGIIRPDYQDMNRYPLIELQGKNILLRNFTPGDAEQLLEYYIRNKKHLEPFEPLRDTYFYTIEGQTSSLNASYKQFINGSSIDLGIFKNERLIGKIKLSNIVYGSFKSGIIGYSIDEKEQGHGYMKESVRLFSKYAFEECGLHRIEASALVNNIKSRRVLESCQFKFVGINEKYLSLNGKWQDHATYYLVKEDFLDE